MLRKLHSPVSFRRIKRETSEILVRFRHCEEEFFRIMSLALAGKARRDVESKSGDLLIWDAALPARTGMTGLIFAERGKRSILIAALADSIENQQYIRCAA